jgi:Sec-independent protein translocase protein TatA
MLALLGNIGPFEMVLIAVIAILIFGKDLPQAASRAYYQVRKLRGSLDDLRRESGIDRELRNIERSVREAEWQARRAVAAPAALPPQEPASAPAPPAPGASAEEPAPPPAPPSPPASPG